MNTKFRLVMFSIIILTGSLANAICGGIPLGMTQREAEIEEYAFMEGRQSLTLSLARIQNIGVKGDKQASCSLIATLFKTVKGPICPPTELSKQLDPIRTIMRLSHDLGFSESIDLTELNTPDSNEYMYRGIRIVRADDKRVEKFYDHLMKVYYNSVKKSGAFESYSFQSANINVCQELDKFNL